jgi:uncharacterized protein (DUF2164 family)
MTSVERFGLLSEEERRRAVEEIITYFEKERGEELGLIGAGELLDFFLQTVSPGVYNKAISDAQELVKKGAEDIDFTLGVLRKQK